MRATPPVITIDGPSGCGKGTVAHRLAVALGWRVLDSGVVYRAMALSIDRAHLAPTEESTVLAHLAHVNIQLVQPNPSDETAVFLETDNVTDHIRSERCSQLASLIAQFPGVRAAALPYQRMYRVWPGLIADGRDMGTVVFPDAPLKFFLDAAVEERAHRRHTQLIRRGVVVSFESVLSEMEKRDYQDRTRLVAPTLPAADAIILDTTHLSVEDVFDRMLTIAQRTFVSTKVTSS
ncbi:MAG: cytidylate kinase [Gammaproteobacteria bacterium RIFCSPHIGHO2_12_FULL_45_9]|nr:MAG: cytidylate kinase [Gammaproteobacteria bacterium RIFCSPHIGHO2_12_FULL_45_9]